LKYAKTALKNDFSSKAHATKYDNLLQCHIEAAIKCRSITTRDLEAFSDQNSSDDENMNIQNMVEAASVGMLH